MRTGWTGKARGLIERFGNARGRRFLCPVRFLPPEKFEFRASRRPKVKCESDICHTSDVKILELIGVGLITLRIPVSKKIDSKQNFALFGMDI